MTERQPSAPLRGDVVLTLDQGTTNTKALLLDAASGTPVAEASAAARIGFPAPGWVEQDAAQLWESARAAMDACLEAAPDARLVGLALSSQRETVVCWSRSSGSPLGPALGWQDARTAAWCDALAADRPEAPALVRSRTGLSLDPMFSAPKLRAALDAAVRDGADPGDVAVGTVDSWLLWNLTGEHVTEAGNASRTLLFDLTTLAWDDELLDLFGVARHHLPEVRASDAGFGRTRAGLGRLGAGIPVVAVLADSHAAMYLHGCTTPGSGKATYGTGSSVMTPTLDPRPAPDGIATTLAWQTQGTATFAREGNIVATGSGIDWMARTLGAPAGVPGGVHLSALAAEVEDAGGASFVPAFAGLGAPYWDRGATGVIVGVTAGTTPAHLARAALEAVAHQVADVVESMERDGATPVEVLHADGGATASRLLMQLQADLLGRAVEVADVPAASALGVGRLAARTLGFDPAPPPPGERYDPRPVDRAAARRAWARAVSRSRGLAPADPDPHS